MPRNFAPQRSFFPLNFMVAKANAEGIRVKYCKPMTRMEYLTEFPT